MGSHDFANLYQAINDHGIAFDMPPRFNGGNADCIVFSEPSSSITLNVPPDFRPDIDTVFWDVHGELRCTTQGGMHSISIKEATGDYMSLHGMGNLNNMTIGSPHNILGQTTAPSWHGFDVANAVWPPGYVEELRSRVQHYESKCQSMLRRISDLDKQNEEYRQSMRRVNCKKATRVDFDNRVLL